MHQTFYIDIDEEITSIVERLKKTRADEVILVVPKRALLIQSIVNLRILKKEADQINLQLMIVTQDKLGKLLIEKAGILVQQNMEDIPEEESSEKNAVGAFGTRQGSKDVKEESNLAKRAQKGRLDNMGTDNYFDEKHASQEINASISSLPVKTIPFRKEERILNKELVSDIANDIKRNIETPIASRIGDNVKRMGDISPEKRIFPSMDVSRNVEAKREIFEKPAMEAQRAADFSEPKDKKIEDFFHHTYDGNFGKKENVAREEPVRHINLSAGFKKFFIAFGSICAIVFLAAIAYLFIPKATVNITLKTQAKSIDSEIEGLSSVQEIDYDKEVIPTKLVSADQSITQTFTVSGSKSASNQKSHGTIAIYNEFSSSPQSLVATTRFLSENGKLFRLTKSIVVPGTTNVNGEVKPGVIEAEVVADSAGEEYNIGPSKFTIPGFKDSGSDKYNKFYAKSVKAMEGGGNNQGEVKIISDTDIANAKASILGQLNEAIKKKIAESAGEGVVVLDDAVNKDEATYKLSNSSGEAIGSFQIIAQTRATAVVFREADIKSLAAKIISKSGDAGNDIDSKSISLEFGKSNADAKTGAINIKFHANGKILPKIDFDNLKKEIAGKSEIDLEEYLKTYSEIEKAEVTYYPAFLTGRIPFRESQVELMFDLL